MITQWKRRLPVSHQVPPTAKDSFLLNLKPASGLPAYDNTTVFVDRADEAYLEKLAEVF